MPPSRSREGTSGRVSQQLAATINRSYDVEYSDTRPIIELKLRSAGPVLRTEMTREAPVTIVLPFFCQVCPKLPVATGMGAIDAETSENGACRRRNQIGTRSTHVHVSRSGNDWARLTQKRARSG